MAKSNSPFKLQGTIGETTFVRSSTYGDHVRAKRGTYKTATINDALKRESNILLNANIPAKLIKDAIDPYRSDVMKGGSLWPRLVSLFRKQFKETGTFDFSKLDRFEIHADHPFARLLHVEPKITVDQKKSILHVDINYVNHPNFRKVKDVDGYQLTVIVIFPNLKKNNAETDASTSKIFPLSDKVVPFQTKLTIPEKARTFVVCVGIESCVRGKVNHFRATSGLTVISTGQI
jgi:hypothetical protein